MDTPHAEQASRIFAPEQFASDYERYAALLMTRALRIGCAAHNLYADSERRALIKLPERGEGATRYRLSQEESVALAPMLAAREQELEQYTAWRAPVFRNAATLGARLGLNDCEQTLLAFAVIVQSQRVLRNAVECLAPQLRDRPRSRADWRPC